MSRLFVAVGSKATDEQNKAFQDYIAASGLGWWHWINNVWLLRSPVKLSSEKLRDDLMKIYPKVRLLVVEMPGDPQHDGWAGFNDTDKDMFAWFTKNWDK